MKNFFFTIDFEKFSLIENLKNQSNNFNEADYRITKQLDDILFLLDKFNIKSTFFVLGKTAQENPKLIKKIFSCGHEIASHGFNHVLLNHLNLDEIEKDIKHSKDILEEIINSSIIGYRAPCFSFIDELPNVLERNNFIYDSSLNFSSFNSRYGKSKILHLEDQSFSPFLIEKNNIIEIPLSNLQIRKLAIPISGGGMGRLIPRFLWVRLCNKYLEKNDNLIFYTHPWEIDTQLPYKFTTIKKTFATYYNVARYLKKFEFIITSLNHLYPNSRWLRIKDLDMIRNYKN